MTTTSDVRPAVAGNMNAGRTGPEAEKRAPALFGRFPDYPVAIMAKRMIRGKVNPWLARLTARRDYDLSKTLTIAGFARSGTTWLAELAATIPRSAMLFEPLYHRKLPQARAAGFGGMTYVEPWEEWPSGEQYMAKVLRGRVLTSTTMEFTKCSRAIRPERWIIKFVHANLLLGWLNARFPICPPVLIVRHPCAMVASRLQETRWRSHNKCPSIPKLYSRYPHLAEIVKSCTDLVEVRAAIWCISTYVPFAMPQPYPFHLVSYEQLVREPESVLIRVFRHWNMDVPEAAFQRVHVPSQTTKKHSNLRGRGDPLMRWRKILSTSDVSRIMRIVKAFGLDFYTEAPEPDYDRFYGARPLKCK